jgi:hypothetical protein
MAYTPNPNEFTISGTVTAGWPTATAAYLRVVVPQLTPGVNATLQAQLLDINGNELAGGTFVNTYTLVGLTSFNNLVHTLIQQAASGYGVTLL